ncbi:hypothetical protein CHUAL_003717 [Chamberlinius hualienensis]
MAEASGILSPGQTIRPYVPVEVAKDLIWRLYKLKVDQIKELNGYDDVNYYIQVEKDEEHSKQPLEYVFKVSNSVDSETPELFDAFNEMMLYLYKEGFVVNKPIPNASGELKSLETLQNNDGTTSKNIARLLTFIPGEILYNVPCTIDICFQTGHIAAALDNSLMGFKHPFYETRQTIWMLSNAAQVKQFIFAIKDESRKEMVERILNEFEDVVIGNMHKLQKGLIHGDINEQNLITRIGEDKTWIHGILDFGDSQYNCYIFEVALAATYMMLLGNKDNFVEFGGHTVAGYVSQRVLSHLEWHLLKICIEARYCQSLVMGAYTNFMDPTNTYVLTTQKKGWEQLTILHNTNRKQIYTSWKKIFGQHGLKFFADQGF